MVVEAGAHLHPRMVGAVHAFQHVPFVRALPMRAPMHFETSCARIPTSHRLAPSHFAHETCRHVRFEHPERDPGAHHAPLRVRHALQAARRKHTGLVEGAKAPLGGLGVDREPCDGGQSTSEHAHGPRMALSLLLGDALLCARDRPPSHLPIQGAVRGRQRRRLGGDAIPQGGTRAATTRRRTRTKETSEQQVAEEKGIHRKALPTHASYSVPAQA
mmetsp:Transcript_5356/g.33577  ORF Transcript_5356/g.33577 Transcript_5356/m.33577 type:complete len:216 (+) Transcript_5356:1076-1723(+)